MYDGRVNEDGLNFNDYFTFGGWILFDSVFDLLYETIWTDVILRDTIHVII